MARGRRQSAPSSCKAPLHDSFGSLGSNPRRKKKGDHHMMLIGSFFFLPVRIEVYLFVSMLLYNCSGSSDSRACSCSSRPREARPCTRTRRDPASSRPCWQWFAGLLIGHGTEGNDVSRRVLTDNTRLARVELLGEVDIVEGTRRRRLVMTVGTRSTNTHDATMWLLQWLSVQSQWLCGSWSVGTPSLMSSLFLGITKKPRKGRPERCVLTSDKACRAVEQHRPRRVDDGIGHQND